MGIDREHSMELRLGAGLQTDVVFIAVAHYLLHHLAHLVDLDGIHHEILGIVVILLRRLAEAAGYLADPVVEYVGKAEQHRRRHIAKLEVIDHLA